MNKIISSLQKIWQQHRFWVCFTAAAAGALLVLAVALWSIVYPYSRQKVHRWSLWELPAAEQSVFLESGDELRQQIQASGQIFAFQVYVGERDGIVNSGMLAGGALRVLVEDASTGQLLDEARCSAYTTHSEGALSLGLSHPVETPSGRYVLRVIPEDLPEGIRFYLVDGEQDYEDGPARCNGQALSGGIVADLFMACPEVFVYALAAGLLVWAGVFGLILFLHFTKWGTPGRFAVCCAVVLTFYWMAFPPLYTHDEEAHCGAVYVLSSYLATHGQPGAESWRGYKNIPGRAGDAQTIRELGAHRYTGTGLAYFLRALHYQRPSTAALNETTALSIAYAGYGKVNMWGYLVGGLGMYLGFVLRLNTAGCVMLARAFNGLAYWALCCLGVWLIPRGKNLLAVFCLMPMCVHVAPTCANDGNTIGLAVFWLGLLLRLREEGRAASWKLWALCGAGTVVTAAYAYTSHQYQLVMAAIPLAYLVYTLLPQKARRLALFAAAAAVPVAVAGWFALRATGHFASPALADPTQKYDYAYLLHSPVRSALVFVRDLVAQHASYFETAFAHETGGIHINGLSLCLFTGLLFLAWADGTEPGQPGQEPPLPPLGFRAALVAAALFEFGCAVLSGFLWTSPAWFAEKQGRLWGVQGRYFLPGLPYLLAAVRPGILSLKLKKPQHLLAAVCAVSGYATFFYLLGLFL